MKTIFSLARTRVNSLKAVLVVGSLTAVAQANAALPEWAGSMGTTITTRVTDTEAAVGPIVVLALVASVGIRLIKRFANKI